MKRALLTPALVALVAGCNSTVTTISSGQFAAPVGLAATSAGDRDLVFIANSGKDGLIALQLCNHPLLDGGSQDPSDTCSSSENAQFIPGRIRVFPATIEAAARTVRVAGARLTLPDGGVPDGGAGGEALAVGADQTLTVVDARSLVDAEHGGPLPKILSGANGVQLGGIGVDVVAANALDPVTDLEVASPSVKVFVATQSPAQLLVLTASLDANGLAQAPTVDATCTLDPVLPRKIAVAPGRGDFVYVADGAGDGVVSIPTASIAGGACPMTRISAGGRPTRSVALNPPWQASPFDNPHAAGEILMMVVDPPLSGNAPGRPLNAGGVLFARTSDGALFPVPPFDWQEAGHEAMQPLQPNGLAREGTFLRAIRPNATCVAHCTPLNFGTSIGAYDLLAVVTSSDGSTTFIDVPGRRFPDPILDSATGPVGLAPIAAAASPSTAAADPTNSGISLVTLSPGDDPAGPLLTILPASLVPGVTHTALWRAIWHSPMIGLDSRAGSLSPGPDPNTVTFVTPPADLSIWTQDPIFQLAPGDVVSLGFWNSGNASCQSAVSTQNSAPFSYEMPIVSISGNTVVLGAVAGTPDLSGACGTLNAVAEFRTAGDKPWLVMNGPTAAGRAATGVPFTARETRFDYPYRSCEEYTTAPLPPCYDPANPPLAANDQSFQFTITADVAPSPGSSFTWQMTNGQGPITYGDPNNLSGFATGVLAYSSPRSASLVFTTLTGSNEVIQADPAILRADITGLQGYR